MRKRALIAAAAFALAGVIAADPASATPLSGLEGLGRPISDDALGNMRGKFVAPNGISYFGIVMSSSWQTPDGITTAATMLFSLDFAAAASGGHVKPELLISWSRECPECDDSSMDVTTANSGYVALTSGAAIPIGSLNTATGVVQTQQIAGSDNWSRNTMAIQIVPAGTMAYDTTGMTAMNGYNDTEHFEDGDTLRFSYSDHQLGLSMTDQGGALQQGVDGNVGQLAQHVFISGSDIVANNNMALVIGIDPAAAAQTLSVQGALTAMKGMGF